MWNKKIAYKIEAHIVALEKKVYVMKENYEKLIAHMYQKDQQFMAYF